MLLGGTVVDRCRHEDALRRRVGGVSRSRTLTVVVADVVGSTELFSKLGVERADDARRVLFASFDAAVEASNGTLVKTMGDGCLLSFGSAADAVTSAVALQHAASRLRERKIPGLRLRIGGGGRRRDRGGRRRVRPRRGGRQPLGERRR
jgi:class 3 adenylate cyclase